MQNREIVIILHNIRSTYNVGSILRTADGFGVNRVIYSGYTPTPLPYSKLLYPYYDYIINSKTSVLLY